MTIAENHLRMWIDQTIRPVLREMLRDELADILPPLITPSVPDSEPYGDFNWICGVYPAPRSTIRIKSAAGLIPGTKKVGKRVLYEKAAVLNWLHSHPDVVVPDVSEKGKDIDAQITKRASKQISGRTKKGVVRHE